MYVCMYAVVVVAAAAAAAAAAAIIVIVLLLGGSRRGRVGYGVRYVCFIRTGVGVCLCG